MLFLIVIGTNLNSVCTPDKKFIEFFPKYINKNNYGSFGNH